MTTRSLSPQTPLDARSHMRPRVNGELVQLVSRSITDRDKSLCLDVYEHRFLTTHQAQRLFFDSYTRARTRLFHLYRFRVLDRFRPLRGAGSHPWYYVLDEIGIQVVAAIRGVDAKDLRYDKAKALAQVFSPVLRHMTEVNDFFSRVTQYARKENDSLSLAEWLGERSCRTRWKGYVRPDGFGRIETPTDAVSFWLELDGGTEVLSRLADKLDRYSTLSDIRGSADLILFSFPTIEREAGARKVMFDCGIPVMTGIFREHMEDPMRKLWLPIESQNRLSFPELLATPRRKLSA